MGARVGQFEARFGAVDGSAVLVEDGDEVDVEGAGAVGAVGVADASGGDFEFAGEGEPRVGVLGGVGGDDGDVVVGGLVVVAAPWRGLVDLGDGLGADRGDGRGEVGFAVAEEIGGAHV